MASGEAVLWTDLAREKGPFFRILHQTPRTQTGLMTVAPGQEAGPPETHAGADQVILVVEGEALVKVWADGDEAPAREGRCPPGTLLVIPAGIQHGVRSVGAVPLVFLTVYGPPEY